MSLKKLSFRKRKKVKSKIIFILISGLIVFLLLLLCLSAIFMPRSINFKYKEIVIAQGCSSEKIAELLKEKKIIRSKLIFLIYVKAFGIEKNLQSGSYILSPSYSLRHMCRVLEGKSGSMLLVRITIPEGYKLTKIADLFEQTGLLSKQEFLDFANNKAKSEFKDKYDFLKLAPSNNIEGFLFPDTYLFAKCNASAKHVFDLFFKQFKKKMIPVWQDSPKRQNLDFYQTLILASIIERESYLKEEMPLISSVFCNRLKNGYRLASCVTVFYALGDIDRNYLTYNDLKVDSKYNTYKYAGLPPTPIASPGIDAFKAAMNPEKSDYYYFVAKGNGSHHFSNSFKEHVAYRKMLKR
ncbi:MAG: endolytic transglycosylase MltG [Candidatus Margulisiibacteriota bacterium]|jgi:UPF0755 protein